MYKYCIKLVLYTIIYIQLGMRSHAWLSSASWTDLPWSRCRSRDLPLQKVNFIALFHGIPTQTTDGSSNIKQPLLISVIRLAITVVLYRPYFNLFLGTVL